MDNALKVVDISIGKLKVQRLEPALAAQIKLWLSRRQHPLATLIYTRLSTVRTPTKNS